MWRVAALVSVVVAGLAGCVSAAVEQGEARGTSEQLGLEHSDVLEICTNGGAIRFAASTLDSTDSEVYVHVKGFLGNASFPSNDHEGYFPADGVARTVLEYAVDGCYTVRMIDSHPFNYVLTW